MSEEMSADQPAHADDQPAPDFQTAFWATKHALAAATAAAFSRHGVHQGQQFILRQLWAEDGQTPGEIARRLGLATSTVTRAATRMEAAEACRAASPIRATGGWSGGAHRARALLEEDVIAAETDKLTERALATFGPAERGSVIRALAPSGATSPDLEHRHGRLARFIGGSRNAVPTPHGGHYVDRSNYRNRHRCHRRGGGCSRGLCLDAAGAAAPPVRPGIRPPG
jgi:hypothetical protein